MKIAITGANGFLGRGIVSELVSRGHEVIAADKSCEYVNCASSVVEGSIFDVSDPYVELGSPECTLHLAWRDGFQHNSKAHMDDLPAHVDFIRKLVDSPLQRLAVMGSMHEVGYFEGGIRADSPCCPENMYGIAKNALRQAGVLLAENTNTDFQWLRGYYIVDSTPYGSSIFSKLCLAAQEGKSSFPFTSGQNQYDFLDYDEFCSQVADAVTGEKGLGVINICSGYPEKLANRVERFIIENDLDISLEYGAFPDRPYDSPAVWGYRDVN